MALDLHNKLNELVLKDFQCAYCLEAPVDVEIGGESAVAVPSTGRKSVSMGEMIAQGPAAAGVTFEDQPSSRSTKRTVTHTFVTSAAIIASTSCLISC